MLSRTLFYALVAINLVLAVLLALPFLGVVPAWSSASEPERIAKQLSPESIRVLPPGVAQAAHEQNRELASSAPVVAVAASEPSAAGVTTTAVEVQESHCIAYKGLADELAGQLAARANKQGSGVQARTNAVTTTSYWVHIPPDGGKDAAEKRLEVLQRNGISDYFIVRDSGANQYAVSLGLYRAEELAKRRLDALQKVGIKTATITNRENTSQRLELTGAQSVLDAFAAEISRTSKDKQLQRDKCEGG